MTKKNTFVGTPFWMAPEVILQTGYSTTADIWSFGIMAIELAKGLPPYSDMHPMRVLFIIPKNEPPVLDGNFSKAFKEFIALCLVKGAADRTPAKELLKHKFIKAAKKTSYLIELIDRAERYKAENGDDGSGSDESDADEDEVAQSGGNWDFGTVKKPTGAKSAPEADGTVKKPSPAKAAAQALADGTVRGPRAPPPAVPAAAPAAAPNVAGILNPLFISYTIAAAKPVESKYKTVVEPAINKVRNAKNYSTNLA